MGGQSFSEILYAVLVEYSKQLNYILKKYKIICRDPSKLTSKIQITLGKRLCFDDGILISLRK